LDGVTKLFALPRKEMAIERVFAPKGLHDSARGSNPGNRPEPHRALKIRISKPRMRRTPFSTLKLGPFP
jgi:hypothetical protein